MVRAAARRVDPTRGCIIPAVFAFLLTTGVVESPGQATTAPASRIAEAQSYKELGDRHVSGDRLTEAAEAYLQALALARDAFSHDDRVEMAVYISWEDRLAEALRELQLVLDEAPDHVGARSHLARVYAWSGRLTEAILEADRILEATADHRDALLVKADALEWKGHFRKAIPVYEEILGAGTDFDARLGLSYALLSAGDRAAARENTRLAFPGTPRQQAQLAELTETIRALVRPHVDLGHSYYEDSDANQSNRYTLLHGFGLGNHDFQLQLTRTDSRDRNERARSRSASFSFSSNLAEGLSIGAGIGLSRPDASSAGHRTTGRFTLDGRISNGGAGISVSSDVLTDTIELIANRIRVVSYRAQASKPLSDRLSLSGAYTYRDYSDGNAAHDVELAPEVLLATRPRVSLGYQFRFQDSRGQSQSGYFDPDDYLANRAFASVYYERAGFYTYLHAFAGRQQYTRNGVFTGDSVRGGAFSLGFMPASSLRIEIHADGGNFRAGSVSGFNYVTVGSRISITL